MEQTTLWIGLALILVLFFSGVPLFVVFGLGGIALFLVYLNWPIGSTANLIWGQMDSHSLIAVPLYTLAGYLMLEGGSSKYLIEVSNAFLGHIRGGLAIATVSATTVFAALSGSSFATAAAIGAIMIPQMRNAGYSDETSTGVVCCSAPLGNMIPPSIFFVIYGSLLEVPIGAQFIAGVFPGLLIAVLLALVAYVVCVKSGYKTQQKVPWSKRGMILVKSIPVLLMPLVVLGGIYAGICTPTEAASLASVYAIFLGVVIYRQLGWTRLWATMKRTVYTTGSVLFMVATAILVGQLLVLSGIPQAIGNLALKANVSSLGFLCMVSVVLLILGVFMEAIPMLYVIGPLTFPTAMSLGINPYQYGTIFLAAVMIGQITPPMAVMLFIVSGIAKVPVNVVFKGAVPYLVALVLGLVAIILLPELSTWLPAQMYR